MAKKDLDEIYSFYKEDPTPDNLNNVVKVLEPSINYAVSSIGAADDRLVRQKARIFAGLAVQKYDPTAGADLKTWVNHNLMQIRRFRRETQQPIKVPERQQLEAYTLFKAEQNFAADHEREPDLVELSDYSGIPIRKIEKIRRSQRLVPSETTMEGFGGMMHAEPDLVNEALDYIYQESDKIDRQIIELKTGYGGKFDPIPPKDIAKRLKITPSQLSRRSSRMAFKIQQYEQALQQVT
jgi:DNA-directed RNA polymerase specialized sigma subunit